jgi:hypothetical protein
MSCGGTPDNMDPEMKARNKEIESQLRRDKKAFERELKILLLGSYRVRWLWWWACAASVGMPLASCPDVLSLSLPPPARPFSPCALLVCLLLWSARCW